MKKGNFKALLPIGVFLVLYLGLGIVFEYVMKIQRRSEDQRSSRRAHCHSPRRGA